MKTSMLIIVMASVLVGCSNSKTTETKEELESNTATTEQVASQEETQKFVPHISEKDSYIEGDISKWIAESLEILESDLNDPKLETANNDEGFECYLKANEIKELRNKYKIWIPETVKEEIPKEYLEEETAFEKDLNNVFMLQSLINHLQFSRTSHLGTEGQAIESVELADQWREVQPQMKQANEYMKKLFHDLDVAFNHNGEGETYGVTYTMGGENIKEMIRFWEGGE
ncbi:hypothetical protein [Paraliobacillus sp. JSM ZJ581]|uniref:hypothetical protein n=1 Tax=Paraliobacillus sp. JSM ZJ581 TaxID=3342118 RepID=UPI0035A8F301